MFSHSRALGALAVVLTGAPLVAQNPAPQKIAYVNTQAIMEAAPGRRAVDSVLQREMGLMQLQVSKWSDSVQSLITKFNAVSASLSQAERDKRATSIDQLRSEFSQKTDDLQQRANARQSELVQPLLDQIKLVLEDVRVEGGWTMILDAAQGSPIVAADKNLNISERVIAKLRTMAPPPIATKADDSAKGAPKTTPGPLATPAGIGGRGAAPPPKKPDSTTTKDSTKKDSTKVKRPDSTTKKPDNEDRHPGSTRSMQPQA